MYFVTRSLDVKQNQSFSDRSESTVQQHHQFLYIMFKLSASLDLYRRLILTLLLYFNQVLFLVVLYSSWFMSLVLRWFSSAPLLPTSFSISHWFPFLSPEPLINNRCIVGCLWLFLINPQAKAALAFTE